MSLIFKNSKLIPDKKEFFICNIRSAFNTRKQLLQ